MHSQNETYKYLPEECSFVSSEAVKLRTVYFPLCGTHGGSLKSAITPFLSGDIKIDKNRYLTKPASREDLRRPLRDFFCYIEGRGVFSLADHRQGDSVSVEIGQLWHKVLRKNTRFGLEIQAWNFVPVTADNVELMRVMVKNISTKSLKVVPTFSVPIFGRPLANKHDHEHVTSLLNRIEQRPQGVLVRPSMVFDERGHTVNETVYYVFGITDAGQTPAGTFPTAESFYGESGGPEAPEAVMRNISPAVLPQEAMQGKEAMGALRFQKECLSPGQAREYLIVMGIGSLQEDVEKTFKKFNSIGKWHETFAQNKACWAQKTNSVVFQTADQAFNDWMRWVMIQPVLRRIFGCSFLPDHDYGKGGRGWRDIWQDLLSLILIEPEQIRETLIQNFAGVRIDGSNATIIGPAPGEFTADRNAIARVWMDHGVWPFMTLLLYIHQTGDYEILLEKNTYFRDAQLSRALINDAAWRAQDGHKLKDRQGNIYYGSILEHLLVQHLVQFFNVGEHNIIRLEDADWNDGLDMASQRGESAAFTSSYGGNLLILAELLENLSRHKGIKEILLAREMMPLLDSLTNNPVHYDQADAKKSLLFETYFKSVQPAISGRQIKVRIQDVVQDLRKKGNWIFARIRQHEKITVEDGKEEFSWFNGYYDNQGECVEGKKEGIVRMTLTGQVFPIMSGLAEPDEIEEVIRSVDRYLKDKKLGGYRLNTDFGLPHYLDLGRAFGFAYGTKENGSFFNHMVVLYAYALYKRGFARKGYEVLRSIYRMSVDMPKSRIYPGVPEYFDSEGRGHYHYLTGSASWFILTLLTQVFGVRGEGGDLILSPKLVKEEFGKDHSASVTCSFAAKHIFICYVNEDGLDHGEYGIKEVFLNNRAVIVDAESSCKVKIKRQHIVQTPGVVELRVLLGSNPP